MATKKYCLITGGVVKQVRRSQDAGYIECPETVYVGMLYNGTDFTTPPPPTPVIVPPTPQEKRMAFTIADDNDHAFHLFVEEIELRLLAIEAKLTPPIVSDTIKNNILERYKDA